MTAQAAPATEVDIEKVQYRVTNWPEYDRALVRRQLGSVLNVDMRTRNHLIL